LFFHCLWTGKSLKDNFVVDHVIPFVLWHNNDAWNFLPVSKATTGKKSNKLPSAELLKQRKDQVIADWELHAAFEDVKFFREAKSLVVLPRENWQAPLFGQLCSAIEMTALQRGVGRWPLQ
jgi:hypothetical protein